MTSLSKVLTIAGATLLFAITGCKKEGCKDPNADNYDSKATESTACYYRYANAVVIHSFPATKPDNSSWDSNNGPDIRVEFSRNATTGYDYQTETKDDQTGPGSYDVPSGIQFTNETWKYVVIDEDGLFDDNDIIATGTFNPLSSGSSGKISIQNGGLNMDIEYITY
ncbi:MAG: hypothetical protein U0V74_17145 [Chitinophagales bacterium]